MENVALVDPAGTGTEAGTVTVLWLLDRLIPNPPVGAAVVRVTVPVDDPPPETEVGFRVKFDSPTGPSVREDPMDVVPNFAVSFAVVDFDTTLV